MSQPAQPAPIPGLITAAGITPAAQPAGPGEQTPPAPPAPAPAAPPAPQQQPVPPATAMVTAQPPAPQLPASLLPPAATTVTVPGLNPAPPAVPAPPPAPAAAPQPAPAPATGDQQDRGYPQGVPLEQMSAEQREAYWKYHARHWETRAKERGDYDALKTKAEQYDQHLASQATEQEKAITAARAEGERTATARAAVVLVDAHVRAGLQQRLLPHQVEALASNLNHNHFLGADGLTVDAVKVAQFVDTVAPQAQIQQPAVTAPVASAVPGALPVGVPAAAGPAGQPVTGLPRALPDLGQGAQTTAPLDKLEAGRQQARAFLTNGGYR